jgi:hypothetical protein
MAEVGFYLGYTRISANWDTEATAEIEAIVRKGYRRFLDPPALDKGGSHNWTWRWVLSALPIGPGLGNVYVNPGPPADAVYPLPDDFAGIANKITYDGKDLSWVTVKIVPSTTIRQMYQFPSIQIFRPHMAALEAIRTDGTSPQRWQLLIWPLCTNVYTLWVKYKPTPNILTSTAPYPWGGAPYSELLLAMCLAEAELYCNDAAGERNKRMLELLKTAVDQDLQNTEPDYVGYNGDRSDDVRTLMNMPPYHNEYVAFGGVIPGVTP